MVATALAAFRDNGIEDFSSAKYLRIGQEFYRAGKIDEAIVADREDIIPILPSIAQERLR